MDQLDWVLCVLIGEIDHKHDNTMDMLRDLLRTQPLCQIRLDIVSKEGRGQWLGINDAEHDDQSVLMQGNDVSSDSNYP